jgi:hypothetical protein
MKTPDDVVVVRQDLLAEKGNAPCSPIARR